MKKIYFVFALVASLMSASASAQLFGPKFQYGILLEIEAVNLAALNMRQDSSSLSGITTTAGAQMAGAGGGIAGALIGGVVGAVVANNKSVIPGYRLRIKRDDDVLVTEYIGKLDVDRGLAPGDRIRYRPTGSWASAEKSEHPLPNNIKNASKEIKNQTQMEKHLLAARKIASPN